MDSYSISGTGHLEYCPNYPFTFLYPAISLSSLPESGPPLRDLLGLAHPRKETKSQQRYQPLPGQCQVLITSVGGWFLLGTPLRMMDMPGSCPSRSVMVHKAEDSRGFKSSSCVIRWHFLPELEFRNWSGRYFSHAGRNVSGLFL